jgi:hypothetical protein
LFPRSQTLRKRGSLIARCAKTASGFLIPECIKAAPTIEPIVFCSGLARGHTRPRRAHSHRGTVSWKSTQDFCRWLSQSPRLFNFQGYPDLVWVKFDHFSIKA